MAYPVGVGFKSYIQFAPEAQFNVAVAATSKLEVINWNVNPVVGVIQDPSLYSGQSRRAMYQGGLLYRGTFTVRMNYDGLLELYRGVFGTYDGTTTVESGVIDHKFTEGATLKTYTIEAVVGDVPTGKCFRLTGAKFVNLKVTGTAGTGNDAMLQAEFTVVARDMQSNVTPTVGPTFPSLFPVLYHQATVVDDGTVTGGVALVSAVAGTISLLTTFTRSAGSFTTDGVIAGMQVSGAGVAANTTVASVTSATVLVLSASGTNGAATLTFTNPIRIRSFELDYAQPHDEGRFYLSSLNVDELIRSDFLVAKWRITQEFVTQTQFDLARAFTAGSPRLLFQHPTTIGAVSKREFELRSGSAQITDWSQPVQGYGIIIATATWEAFQDATDTSAVFARFRNTAAALT